jgi:hypothetical protein
MDEKYMNWLSNRVLVESMSKIPQGCVNQVLRAVEERLSPRPIVRAVQIRAAQALIEREIRKLRPGDRSMNVAEYVRMKFPQYADRLSEVPSCVLHHTVGECIDSYRELKHLIR